MLSRDHLAAAIRLHSSAPSQSHLGFEERDDNNVRLTIKANRNCLQKCVSNRTRKGSFSLSSSSCCTAGSMSRRTESCSAPGTTRTSKIRLSGRLSNVICLPSENSKTSRFGFFNILKTASASVLRRSDACSLSENRNRTLVRSIRQTGQGVGASSSISRTTQFECQSIFLIPRRCPALASSIRFAYSVQNQPIRASSHLGN